MIYQKKLFRTLVMVLSFVTFSARSLKTSENKGHNFCTCITSTSICNCKCENLSSSDHLEAESSVFPSCDTFILELVNSSVPYLPQSLFSKLKKTKILGFTLNNSTVYLLAPHSPKHSPFEDISFEKAYISIIKSSSLAGWKWDAFYKLSLTKGFLSFNVLKTELLYLPDEFSGVAAGKIEAITIIECKLRWLGKGVFRPLHKLRSLELRGNLLKSIERDQLPTPGSALKVLDLGNNKLTHIPHDLLEGIDLNTFFIDKNPIVCLEARIFTRAPSSAMYELKKLPECEVETIKEDLQL